ncbi:MAG TPA: hypothetical protein DIT32_03545 [Peptococcaceae bacterium]|nr:hypothetical protein [Peptococcaceae bacterium]
MSTELTITVPFVEVSQDINVLEVEINTITAQARAMALSYIIEIGRRLRAAKELMPYGRWGEWLQDKVHYSQSSAENYMRIAEEYGSAQINLFAVANSQTLENLGYSKLVALLALPADDRATFAEEKKADEISVRELQAEITKYKEEVEKAKNAAKEAVAKEKAANEQYDRLDKDFAKWQEEDEKTQEKLRKQVETLQTKMTETEKKLSESKAELVSKGTETNMFETADAEEEREWIRQEAIEETTKALEEQAQEDREELQRLQQELNQSIIAKEEADRRYKEDKSVAVEQARKIAREEAQAELERLEREKQEALDKIIATEKKLNLASNPNIQKLNFHFEEIQKSIKDMQSALADMRGTGEAAKADKFEAVVRQAVTQMLGIQKQEE